MKAIKTIALALTVVLSMSVRVDAQLKLNGAGATFPYVIYSKWFDVYSKKENMQFNYQSIGSGGGIKQTIEGTVDFGATDGPMSDDQLKEVKAKQGSDVLHIPTVMGAVVVSYNLPTVGQGLRMTSDVIAEIFLGQITKWNDSKIAAINPGKNLPNQSIIVARRSDGSGTTNIFTDYLTKVSRTWAVNIGRGNSVNWPTGLGGKGNEGVAGIIKQAEGAIGYVELAYAIKNNLPYAVIKNKAGEYVEASFESVSAAAAGSIKKMPADFRVSITDAEGKDSYPISGYTWLLVYQNMKDKQKAQAIVGFLKWAMKDGQTYAKDLYYAPLPREVVKLCEKAITTIAVN